MQTTNRIQGRWRPAAAVESVRETVEHHPVPATFVTFGVGMGIGVALGLLLAETVFQPPQPTLSQRTLDALSQVLPDSVMRTLRSCS
jgi:hypothetical protein